MSYADGQHARAERTGFASPAFRNTLPDNSFDINRVPRNELGESGCSRLLPVTPGYSRLLPVVEVVNRDKNGTSF
ncbi:MAG: hypothetical protein ACI9G1_003316 [Pirellulaceae bacterium]|jgi:hypothetical protein